MKKFFNPLILALIVLISASLACNLSSASPPMPEAPPPTETAAIQEPTATEAQLPAPELSPATEEIETESPPVENANQCTVLQDLNLRTGPGLAYHTPIGVIKQDTVVEPVSYYPLGVPGGTWVLIEEKADHPAGWIAAGENYINCTFDLGSLPAVQVNDPPPPLTPRSAQSSDAEGTCFPEGTYGCEVVLTNESLVQFKIFLDGKELTEKDNVDQVEFIVKRKNDQGKEVYRNVENNSAYCIFGGNQPCNSWEIKNNTYYWPGGPALEPGKYFIDIRATVDGSNEPRWAAQFSIDLP